MILSNFITKISERQQRWLCSLGFHEFNYMGVCPCGKHTYTDNTGILERYERKRRLREIKKNVKRELKLNQKK